MTQLQALIKQSIESDDSQQNETVDKSKEIVMKTAQKGLLQNADVPQSYIVHQESVHELIEELGVILAYSSCSWVDSWRLF